MVFIAMTNTVVTSSRPQEVGIQTGMNQTFRNLGTTLGPAIAATILTSFVIVYTYPNGMGGFVSRSVPTIDAFRSVFAFGADGRALIYPTEPGGEPRPVPGLEPEERPIRFTADGRRESLVAHAESAARPAPASSGTTPSGPG